MKESTGFKERVRIFKYEPKKVDKESNKVTNNYKSAISWTANMRIEKYNTKESYKSGIPDEIQEVKGNTATYKGLFTLWNLAMGKGTTDSIEWPGDGTNPSSSYTGAYPLNSTYTYLGVGSNNGSNTDPLATDTDLNNVASGTAGQDYLVDNWQTCNTNYPQISTESGSKGNVLQVKATFDAGDATGPWQEWGIANGIPSDPTSAAGGSDRNSDNTVLFNRRVENMGVKGGQATWVIVADLIIQPTANS